MDITTLLFLGLAVLIILKLRNVLGTRTGHERPPFDPLTRRDRPPNGADKVVPLPPRAPTRPVEAVSPAKPNEEPTREAAPGITPASGPLATALQAILHADRNFDADHFLGGARMAYEMIVNAFAAGDRKTLRPLLSKDVFDGFDSAMTEREKIGHRVESSFIGIDKAEITEAAMRGSTAQITVRFVSKLIQATRDPQGTVIDGDPTRVTEVTDVWTFARDVGSRDPNWRLVATGAA
jgi:predicted lipid-binding transport protein (Tim44 family)